MLDICEYIIRVVHEIIEASVTNIPITVLLTL